MHQGVLYHVFCYLNLLTFTELASAELELDLCCSPSRVQRFTRDHSPASQAMDLIRELGVDPSLPRKDLESKLLKIPHPKSRLNELRRLLFSAAQKADLANTKDILMNRRDAATKPAVEKYAEDVCEIVHSLKNDVQVKRTLVSSGKRSSDHLQNARQKRSSPQLIQQSSLHSLATHREGSSSTTEETPPSTTECEPTAGSESPEHDVSNPEPTCTGNSPPMISSPSQSI